MGGFNKFNQIIIILLFILPASYADIYINEIMYDFPGVDNNQEYIELFIDSYYNLNGYIIEDSSSQDILELLQFINSSYALIVEEGFNYTGINASIYSVGATIGNNLGNTNDFIILKDLNSSIIDSVSYNNSFGANGNGNSLCNENEWGECFSTPGNKNIFEVVSSNSSTEVCDWKIDLFMEDFIFIDSVDFNIKVEKISGEEKNITVRGVIEDLFGREIKHYKPWTDKRVVNKASKKYSPNLPEGVYQLRFWLDDITCDHEKENNEIVKLIAVNPLLNQKDSSLEIERIYLGNDKEAEWGDQFTVKVNIYKGDETKQSVQLWVEKDEEKISKTTKVIVEDEYKYYPLTLPIQLLANCNQKLEDGTATLVLEAFGLHEEQKFTINDIDEEICKDYSKAVRKLEKEFSSKEVVKEEVVSSTLSNLVLEKPEDEIPSSQKKPTSEGIVIYESNSSKAQKIIPSLLVVTFGMLSMVLVMRK